MIYSLNRNRWSFASGEISLRGKKYVGLQDLNPSEEIKREPVMGNGSIAVGRVRGQHAASASISMLLVEFAQLLSDLGNGFSDVPFDVVGTFIETTGDGIYTIEIPQACIAKVDAPTSNDGKAYVVKVDLSVITPISWNGLKIIDTGSDFDFGSVGIQVGFGVGLGLAF